MSKWKCPFKKYSWYLVIARSSSHLLHLLSCLLYFFFGILECDDLPPIPVKKNTVKSKDILTHKDDNANKMKSIRKQHSLKMEMSHTKITGFYSTIKTVNSFSQGWKHNCSMGSSVLFLLLTSASPPFGCDANQTSCNNEGNSPLTEHPHTAGLDMRLCKHFKNVSRWTERMCVSFTALLRGSDLKINSFMQMII